MLRNMFGIGMLLNTLPYRKGQEAAQIGRPLSDNPYSEGSSPWTDWQLGWRVSTRLVDIENSRATALKVQARSAFDMGRAAALNGKGASANPFLHSNPAHEEWRLGWAEAARTR